jgi:general secretion pathway protein H
MQRQRGLTLLELLVVLAIIGVASAGIALAVRDGQHNQLELEAQRLIAHLEAARVTSRTSGVTLLWHSTEEGYAIDQAPGTSLRNERWLHRTTVATASTPQVVLGPEPIIAPVSITLSQATLASTGTQVLRIGTDGLRPFQVLP